MKETVGAQYLCFNTMDTDGRWTSTFAEEVEKTEVVKSVKVTENGEPTDTYASGAVYDSDITTTSTDIEVEIVAFPADTLAKLRGDNVDTDGLILSGGNRPRPYFAYGKVVKLRKGGYRYDWYPKCKLSENSDDISTSEEKANEQTDTIKIKWIKTSAYNLTWSQFKTSTETPEYLASAYLKNFERAGVEEEEARRQYARSWYDFLESGVEPAGRYIVRFIPA